ncbi:hypothetical protein SPRG_15583 [Saprolegnia parasitica CBS 223.65]|nr:hypothetical protein SPRG_15583 [Saprolegnia parasitica CBS 223.65]KDO16770.1 hypothetical protein SPRG_15583 [Saprolegnia parasitica CBS 223.65]|eukprot:XP_012212524.1 hypothetical protein SPRG_15583 [Saprolegnia parasitica CBS 223.65]
MGNKQGKPARSKSVGDKPVASKAKETTEKIVPSNEAATPESPPDQEEIIEQWKLFNDLENREEADV